MRIVYLSPLGILGGAERSLLDLIKSIRTANPASELHLIACGGGPLIPEAQRAGASVAVLPMPRALSRLGDSGGSSLRAAWELIRTVPSARRFASELRAAVADTGAEIIHSNGIKCHLLTGLARLEEAPLIWHVRDFIGQRPLARRLLRWAASPAVTVIANSRAVAEDVRQVLGGAASGHGVEVVYNGIDIHHFSPDPDPGIAPHAALRSLHVGPADTVRVGLVGSYARWKGHDLLLQAAGLARSAPGAGHIRYYIVGGPIYETAGSQFSQDELRELATALGVDDQVEFIPFVHDPAPVYRAMDIVVHASIRPEPFGRTIVEAMSCGRPVIVSNEGGAAELVRDGHDALAIRPRDPGALAAAILSLAGDPVRRQRLGVRARQSAVSRFDRQRVGREVLALYRRLRA
jgi:glycosyltransferase involved in cell wall biosynthesis